MALFFIYKGKTNETDSSRTWVWGRGERVSC